MVYYKIIEDGDCRDRISCRGCLFSTFDPKEWDIKQGYHTDDTIFSLKRKEYNVQHLFSPTSKYMPNLLILICAAPNNCLSCKAGDVCSLIGDEILQPLSKKEFLLEML